jgi:uncharacterized OB-fold protein
MSSENVHPDSTEASSRHPYRPRFNPDMETYWNGVKAGKLLYQVCLPCKSVIFHPRVMCPYCLSDDVEYRESAGRGKIYSFTIQHYASSAAWKSKLPYALGIVEMEEGYFMFAEIDPPDLSVLRVGVPVTVWFDRVDDETVLPKFRV